MALVAALAPPARRTLHPGAVAVAAATIGVLLAGAAALAGTGRPWTALAGGWTLMVGPAVLVTTLVALLVERRTPTAALGRDAVWCALHLAVAVPLLTLLAAGCTRLVGGPAARLGVLGAGWPPWAVATVALVAMDGANWLAHWADHRFGALWRLHAVHHQPTEVGVLTAFRAHPLSHLPGFVLAAVPAAVLAGARPLLPALITAYICAATASHAAVGWTLGPLGRVLVSPAYHRLHHDRAVAGLNLGVVLTVWDVVAGRALFPVPGAAPRPTGHGHSAPDDRRHLAGVARALASPFRTG